MTLVSSEAAANPTADYADAAMVLAGIARAVVQRPERVAIQTLREADGALLTLRVDPTDVEILLGSGGRTARSLRTVITALGRRSGQRFSLEIQSHPI